ncbi:MAG: 5-bromo-4-chloroindolyl phosphate hydrolysis family protein [Pikeienuella sp.]
MSNAKRFGGTYSTGGRADGQKTGDATPVSPEPQSPLAGRKASSFSWRVLGLYIAPSGLLLPGVLGLLTADLPRIGWALGGYALMMFGAWMTGQGLKAEAAFAERLVAKPPAFPRKMFGAGMIGLALFGIMFVGIDVGLLPSLFYGALATGAHIFAFGMDPMKAKGVTSHDGADVSHVADRLEEAEEIVAATVAAARQIGDRGLETRIDRLAYAARDILREIQADPRDFRRARKFLSVHLVGLRDATQKYASAKTKGAADMRAQYEDLLTDLEASFAKQRETLLIDDRVDLEIEIEVLRDRLKEENMR